MFVRLQTVERNIRYGRSYNVEYRDEQWTNSSLEGTWKATFVDYFEVFSLNQSDQSVIEPRSEPSYFRLLGGMNANDSTEISGQLKVAEQKVILGYAIETERPAVELSVWLKAGTCLLSKTCGKGPKFRLCPRNLNTYVLIYSLLMIIFV